MALLPAEDSAAPVTDAASFDALYRQNVGAVFRYAASRLGNEEGEDVTAEVFHAAIRAIREGTEVTAAWLMAVVKNKVIDHWRKLERRENKLHLIFGQDAQPEPHERLFAALDRAQVIDVLDQLTERYRLLLMLHYVDGYSAADLADLSGGSVAAVESALARARRSFKSHWASQEARNA